MTSDPSTAGSLGSQFIAIFNEIEGHLRHVMDADPGVSFVAVLNKYSSEYRLPTSQHKTLKAMTALRNAISHAEYYDGRPIAEPVLEVVSEIAAVRDLILTPPRAWDHIPRLTPCVTAPSAPIRHVLHLIHEHDFSQVPVYDNRRYQGLLTTNCIARWFAAQLDGDSVDGDAPVSAVTEFAERQDRAIHVPPRHHGGSRY